MDPNTLNLDPNPGFWPNLDPDPDPSPDPRSSWIRIQYGSGSTTLLCNNITIKVRITDTYRSIPEVSVITTCFIVGVGLGAVMRDPYEILYGSGSRIRKFSTRIQIRIPDLTPDSIKNLNGKLDIVQPSQFDTWQQIQVVNLICLQLKIQLAQIIWYEKNIWNDSGLVLLIDTRYPIGIFLFVLGTNQICPI